MKIPDVGDTVYITALDSMYYGFRAKVKSRKEGKSYNYGCEYYYVVSIDTGDEGGSCVDGMFNDLEIHFKKPRPKNEVVTWAMTERAKGCIKRIADEIGCLTKEQQQAALRAFLQQSIEMRIDSAEVIKNLFK